MRSNSPGSLRNEHNLKAMTACNLLRSGRAALVAQQSALPILHRHTLLFLLCLSNTSLPLQFTLWVLPRRVGTRRGNANTADHYLSRVTTNALKCDCILASQKMNRQIRGMTQLVHRSLLYEPCLPEGKLQ